MVSLTRRCNLSCARVVSCCRTEVEPVSSKPGTNRPDTCTDLRVPVKCRPDQAIGCVKCPQPETADPPATWRNFPLPENLGECSHRSTRTPTSLRSRSPVLSPETLNALENAERLVKDAQKKIEEVSLGAISTPDDKSASGHAVHSIPDDTLLHVREIVESKLRGEKNPKSEDPASRDYTSADSRNPDQLTRLRASERPGNSRQNSETGVNRISEGNSGPKGRPYATIGSTPCGYKKDPKWISRGN
ncbi:uncharacterized protein LOC105698702 [Orussus abietinus]|uniref:uncharacterized protein LOC105698702 n=1 Tax=Orussus abietinus TaxID=222816 RepID=UPI000C715CAA|nr:uncharacterized protein LOC105698702 [Orussus abietinus]